MANIYSLKIENSDQIYHLYNIIRKGDEVRAFSTRNITIGKSKKQIATIFHIEVEKINISLENNVIYLNGRILNEIRDVQKNSYQSIDLSINSTLKLEKNTDDFLSRYSLKEFYKEKEKQDFYFFICHSQKKKNNCVFGSFRDQLKIFETFDFTKMKNCKRIRENFLKKLNDNLIIFIDLVDSRNLQEKIFGREKLKKAYRIDRTYFKNLKSTELNEILFYCFNKEEIKIELDNLRYDDGFKYLNEFYSCFSSEYEERRNLCLVGYEEIVKTGDNYKYILILDSLFKNLESRKQVEKLHSKKYFILPEKNQLTEKFKKMGGLVGLKKYL